MKLCTRSSLAAASAVCLVLAVMTPAAGPTAKQSVAVTYGGVLAALVTPDGRLAAVRSTRIVVAPDQEGARTAASGPEVVATSAELIPSGAASVVVRGSGVALVDSRSQAAAPAMLVPIDVLNAISAAGYLVIAVPSLFFTIPFQVLTGQRSAIVTSLNNIITAVNTILKLVGRSIPPIVTGESEATVQMLSAETLVADPQESEPGAGDTVPAVQESGFGDSDSGKDDPPRGIDVAEDATGGQGSGDTHRPADAEEAPDADGEGAVIDDDTSLTAGDADEPAPAQSEAVTTEPAPAQPGADGNDPAERNDEEAATSVADGD